MTRPLIAPMPMTRRLIAPIAIVLCGIGPAAALAAEVPTLAISYFDNNSEDPSLDALSRGLADMLITDLSVVESIRIVERARLNEILGELDLSGSSFIDPEAALALGRGLAARYVMAGGYAIVGAEMRIDARVFDVESGAVLVAERVLGPKEAFFDLQKDLVDLLIRTLGVELAPTERRQLRRTATESFLAFTHYSRGLAARDAGDEAAARAAFQAALNADPGYAAARTGAERLAAIFGVAARAEEDEVERQLREFDPNSPSAPQELMMMFAAAMTADEGRVERTLAIHTMLLERGLEPADEHFQPVPMNLLSMATFVANDPSAEKAILGACEYFLGRYPGVRTVLTSCRGLVAKIEEERATGTVAQRMAQLERVHRHMRGDPGATYFASVLDNASTLRAILQAYADKRAGATKK